MAASGLCSASPASALMGAPSPRSQRLSDVGIGERTITKIVSKINQINLERESTRQFNESKRRLKFLSMITYPAHLAT
eukprot:2259492-Pleurochrysis_carterae.AAC.2